MRFILINSQVRQNAMREVANAPEGFAVSIAPRTRTLDQNAKFHAMLTDLANSPLKWAGKRRSVDEWKALVISGHAVATDAPGEVIPGLENEFVAIRESSARMTVARSSSLIEYLLAFCAQHGVELHETIKGGFMNEREAA